MIKEAQGTVAPGKKRISNANKFFPFPAVHQTTSYNSLYENLLIFEDFNPEVINSY